MRLERASGGDITAAGVGDAFLAHWTLTTVMTGDML